VVESGKSKELIQMTDQYEVLSPWAEADLIPLKGISPRVVELQDKKIGLFTLTYKHASARVNKVIEEKLGQKYPTAQFNYFNRNRGADFENSNDNTGGWPGGEAEAGKALKEFEEWVKGVDVVIGAVGD
jgi:hypothetical protein